MKEVTLTVNGIEVKMNEFVTKIVTNILTGVLDSIKLDDVPKNAVFTISDKSEKMSVWVSGFFGSGKSHFIKALYYLFSKQKVISDGETKPLLPTYFFSSHPYLFETTP